MERFGTWWMRTNQLYVRPIFLPSLWPMWTLSHATVDEERTLTHLPPSSFIHLVVSIFRARRTVKCIVTQRHCTTHNPFSLSSYINARNCYTHKQQSRLSSCNKVRGFLKLTNSAICKLDNTLRFKCGKLIMKQTLIYVINTNINNL